MCGWPIEEIAGAAGSVEDEGPGDLDLRIGSSR
jgi:hypothetical protein